MRVFWETSGKLHAAREMADLSREDIAQDPTRHKAGPVYEGSKLAEIYCGDTP